MTFCPWRKRKVIAGSKPCLPESVQTLMRIASRTISIAAVFKYGLVDRFERLFDRLFNNLVFKIADAQRSPFRLSPLGDITPPLRPRTVPHPLEPRRKIPKVLFKVFPVFPLGYAIHSGGFVRSQCSVANPQVVLIADVMIQAGKNQPGFPASLFAYPCQVTLPQIILPKFFCCVAALVYSLPIPVRLTIRAYCSL